MSDGRDKEDKKPICSFCGKGYSKAKKLIVGKEATICSDCIMLCGDLLSKEAWQFKQLGAALETFPTPKEIKLILDDYVIGQESAKIILSVAVHNHYKRIGYFAGKTKKYDQNAVKIEKSNVLMVGPTGCGKTLMIQTLANVLNVPLVIVDATSLTEAGYVGEDVESILVRLLNAAEFDVDRAEWGIVYVDEIDKVSRKSEAASRTRDVGGEGVRQALLKLIEGSVVSVSPSGNKKSSAQEDLIQIDTTNILFIFGGAFIGLEKIVENRIGQKKLGFSASTEAVRTQKTKDELLRLVQPRDLGSFGLIPEFVGRIPITTSLNELDESALKKILTKPKNALTKQYKQLFKIDDIVLTFSLESLRAIAKEAIERANGARGLRAILEASLANIMFETPSTFNRIEEIIIEEETITEKKPPTLIFSA